jgi:predicted  nucleic acid-binding Zn-ribbon protein
MHEKVEQLLAKLKAEREEFRVRMHLGNMDAHDEWEKAEGKWENLQGRLKHSGLVLAEKAGDLIEGFEEELRELKSGASATTWKLNMKAKEEIHDLGEDVDKLQHKIADKVEDVRLEVMEELHELGEEISGLYQKIRSRF